MAGKESLCTCPIACILLLRVQFDFVNFSKSKLQVKDLPSLHTLLPFSWAARGVIPAGPCTRKVFWGGLFWRISFP